MDDDRIVDVTNLLEQMKSIRSPHEEVWNELIDELFPYRYSSWKNKEQRGKRHGQNIYDSYALSMSNIAVDGIQGHMVSDSFRWMSPHLSKHTSSPVVRKYLQDLEDAFYFEFQRSNFYESINEYIHDAIIFGTSHMYAQESTNEDRIVFKVIHPMELFVAENFDGVVDTHVRELYLTVKQAYERFGPYHDSIKRMVENKQWLHEIQFVHAVRPRNLSYFGASPELRQFESLYIDVENNIVAKEGGYFVNPFATWRWRKLSHEVYGRSPAWDALRDIKMLNSMGGTLIETAQRHAKPINMIPAEMKTEFDNRAGANNYYMDPNRIPFQLQERSNYPIGAEREEQKRSAIRQHFNVDFFLMLQQSNREMTATEIIEKQNEKIAILGAMIGRFQTEGLGPIIDIVFDIASRAGRMPKIPDEVTAEYGGERIEVDYTGPLAQAQKRLRMQGTQAALQTVLPYAQFDPTVLDRINMDMVAKNIMEAYGMRQESIRSDGEVMEIRKARQEAQAAQMQAENQESQARANRDNAQAANMAAKAAPPQTGMQGASMASQVMSGR